MYVSVTGLKPKGFMAMIRFWMLAIPSFTTAKKSPGNLFCETRARYGYQHTLTAWDSRKSMKRFVASQTHRKAMKVFPQIATGSTITFEAEEMPSWEEALRRWDEEAVHY